MNELPVPCGPWDIFYKDKQSFYNKVLAFGIVCMDLNFYPPAQPGPPSDMVEECDDSD
ncbi:hypothetical protein OBRU01_12357, partial [Operophtera brumata]